MPDIASSDAKLTLRCSRRQFARYCLLPNTHPKIICEEAFVNVFQCVIYASIKIEISKIIFRYPLSLHIAG